MRIFNSSHFTYHVSLYRSIKAKTQRKTMLACIIYVTFSVIHFTLKRIIQAKCVGLVMSEFTYTT